MGPPPVRSRESRSATSRQAEKLNTHIRHVHRELDSWDVLWTFVQTDGATEATAVEGEGEPGPAICTGDTGQAAAGQTPNRRQQRMGRIRTGTATRAERTINFGKRHRSVMHPERIMNVKGSPRLFPNTGQLGTGRGLLGTISYRLSSLIYSGTPWSDHALSLVCLIFWRKEPMRRRRAETGGRSAPVGVPSASSRRGLAIATRINCGVQI